MNLIISAGGSGGHIYPALAIVKKFQEKEKNLNVLYIGTHDRMETDIVPKNNIPYESIKIYGFSKNKIGRDIKNIGYLFKSYYRCIDIMKEFKPDIVIGVGGYVTMPVLMAAKKLNIKCVIHEQNMIPGKTNKFLSRGVDAVFTTFKDSEKYFAKEVKCVYTGHPCGDNVNILKSATKESLGLSKDKKLVLVTSGSQGSSGLNSKLIDFLKLSKNSSYEVLVVTGKNNYEEFIKNNNFSKNIKVIPYLDNMSGFLKNCDLVIARAGAGTIIELLASKTPSILVPSPNVPNNHQFYNAKELDDKHLAIMIEEKNLNSKMLFEKVNSLFNETKEYKELKKNLNKYKTEPASENIYKNIKELLNDTK